MQGIRRSGGLSGRPQARAAFTFAAFIAMLVQAFVVQVHIHETAPVASAHAQAAIASSHQWAAPGHVSDDATGCVLCQALSANGRATLAAGASVIVWSGALYGQTISGLPLAPRTLTHSWRSRAPPTSL